MYAVFSLYFTLVIIIFFFLFSFPVLFCTTTATHWSDGFVQLLLFSCSLFYIIPDLFPIIILFSCSLKHNMCNLLFLFLFLVFWSLLYLSRPLSNCLSVPFLLCSLETRSLKYKLHIVIWCFLPNFSHYVFHFPNSRRSHLAEHNMHLFVSARVPYWQTDIFLLLFFSYISPDD